MSELENLLKIFYQISGMQIGVYDSKFHCITIVKAPLKLYCHTIHRYSKCAEICMQSDLTNLKIVKESGKPITYTCPFGFYTAIAPVKKDGEVIAFVIFSPAIEIKKDCEEIAKKAALSVIPDMDTKMIKEQIKGIPHYSTETLNAYTKMLMLLVKEIERKDLIVDTHHDIASLTRMYIDQNIGNKITLADLSLNLHCSTVTITEHFKNKYNITIMHYVEKKRMILAEELLQNTMESISDIASLCGFKDIEYFSRTFKKYHELPPSKWREQQNNI